MSTDPERRNQELRNALAQEEHQVAQLKEQVRKLEAVAEALNRVPACRLIEIREEDEIDLFPLLAALEKNP